MRRLLRWYGSDPLHLIAMIACFALAAYAGLKLLSGDLVGILVWFIGAAIIHDLLLFPLYAVADRSAQAVLRRRSATPPQVPWVNYVRVPALLSGLLLLVWFPLIFRLVGPYRATTGLSQEPYLGRWLAVTAFFFIVSAFAFAFRLRRERAARA
ncbi:hypothetical protein BH24ACT13_BH24ACT13_02720 [soil metagenome]|jgi:hypothetical protein